MKEVAEHLAAAYTQGRVLYDQYHDAEFARLDLDVYLPGLYRNDSELIVIFLCPEYAAKRWCNLEWRHIRQLIATADAERIMFLSFGNPGDLSGIGILGGDGYIDVLAITPQIAAEKIRKRLGVNRGETGIPQPAAFSPDISRIVKYAPENLIGREAEMQLLDDAWNKAANGEASRPRVLTFVAMGGEGKTSLVAKWAAELAGKDWPSCEAAFAWSFYSQGASESASSDLFLKEAQVFFGDEEMANSARHVAEKGKRLAQLIGAKRTLLILDGVEPLQYAPTGPMAGQLKDYGISTLLKMLAANSQGLCVVTTRYSIPDLKAFRQSAAPEIELKRLSKEAGVELLKSLGVKGTQSEYEKLVEDVKGHALTLNLLGAYLRDAHAGDIRKRDLVKLEEADAEEQGGHAFRVMDAYVQWLSADSGNAEESKKAQRALAILRLMGLFDRPVSADCFYALLKAPAIKNLTELLVEKNEAKRNMALARLEAAKLIAVSRDTSGTLISLDAHPLLREYFAKQLREQYPDSWREAHRRLYKQLITTNEGDSPTLEQLQPLYQAVAHGCLAKEYQSAYDKIYFHRIIRGDKFYSYRLGAYGADLGALVYFFNKPWEEITSEIKFQDQSSIFGMVPYCLRSLGRLSEALEPMRASLIVAENQEDWTNMVARASNLSELELALGNMVGAIATAKSAIAFADHCSDPFYGFLSKVTYANALYQTGHENQAKSLFLEAEKILNTYALGYPKLYSTAGFNYYSLLLSKIERTAWLTILNERNLSSQDMENQQRSFVEDEVLDFISQHVSGFLEDVGKKLAGNFDKALEFLTLGCVAFYEAILKGRDISHDLNFFQDAIHGLRHSGHIDELPRGLLPRAWLCSHEGNVVDAQADLDEAWEMAERGPMPLYQADILLHRARLFFRAAEYPWHNEAGSPRSAKDDLAEARRLIEKHGYWRRKEELEDAEAVIGKLA